jgi:PAP_fibrillin
MGSIDPFKIIDQPILPLPKNMTAKTDLLNILADKNRGLAASDSEKKLINDLITRTEAFNPTPNPVECPGLLNGDWRLIYTSSSSLLNLGRIPFSQLGNIYQSIRTDTSSVYNIAEVKALPYLSSLVSVVAKFSPINAQRVQVNFVRSIAGLQKMLDYRSPSTWIDRLNSGKGLPAIDFSINRPNVDSWLDTTYLDATMRISRGNQGSVFVLIKD